LMHYNPTQLPSIDLHVTYLSRIYFLIHLMECITYLLHTLRIYSNFALFSGSIGLCYHESGNSAFPDMSELVDQSDTSVWNCGTGAALNQPPVLSASFSFTQIFSVLWSGNS
ncbi:hypothetical protein T05_7737, partial [Trichinella murrelli]